MAEKDQEFVEYAVRAIVENPDKVKVERTIDERGVLLSLEVDPADMGKIIGKDGRTAKAIRTLLRVLGAQNDARVNLKIIEPEGGLGRASERVEQPVESVATVEPVAVDMPETTSKEDLGALEG